MVFCSGSEKLSLSAILLSAETLHRLGHSDGLTRAFSVIGNLLILMLAVEIAWDSGSEVDECWKECSPDNHCVHVPLLHASGAEFPL